METGKEIQNADVKTHVICFRIVLFFFSLSFFNWLVGRLRVFQLGVCGLPGIVGLVVYAWMSS